MQHFDEKKFFERELTLALNMLMNAPDNQTQRDRASYAALKLGNLEIAEKYGNSEKMKGLVENAKRRTAV